MSEKRRDKRNRILREGEYQRADGRYRYRYIDEVGKEKWVYSWRLDKNDPTPRGKKWELSLREKEKQIQADLFDHIVTHGGDYSVIELVEKYISLKTGVNHNTRAGYKTVINILKKDPFGKQRIKVDHQLQRTTQMQYVIQEPKTESGIRYVPMSEEVAACFRRIIANRAMPDVEPMIDGHVGFLFLDKNERPMVALHWEKYLQHIVEKYNKIYRIQMPKVTPHVCRHTFCSNMAKSGMNPKTLQYIMGHADISVTLNVYTHVQFDDAQAEMLRLAKA